MLQADSTINDFINNLVKIQKSFSVVLCEFSVFPLCNFLVIIILLMVEVVEIKQIKPICIECFSRKSRISQ